MRAHVFPFGILCAFNGVRFPSGSTVRHFFCAVKSFRNYIIFMATSTPLGRTKFINASIAFGVGLTTSKRRLWTRSSNCSCEVLLTKVERFTLYLLFSVGKGTGPTTLALFRSAVSIIVLVAVSIILLSYARIFMRMRGTASTVVSSTSAAPFVFCFCVSAIRRKKNKQMRPAVLRDALNNIR